MSYLFHNLLLFGRLLRSLGLDVQAGRMLDVAQALEHIGVGRKSEFYHALRALLVHSHQDLPLFDEAFRIFWRRPHDERTPRDLRSLGEQRHFGLPEIGAILPDSSASSQRTSGPEPILEIDRVQPLSYSPREVLRTKDFAKFTAEETAEAKAMMTELRWEVGLRQTRRWTPGRGSSLDFRRVAASKP